MFFYLLFITFFKKEINLFIIFSFIFFIWRTFSSYYYSNGVLDLVNSSRILTLILLINITIKKYPKSTLRAISIVFSSYIILNLISYFIFPQGLYRVEGHQLAWLLGIENQFGFVLIPGTLLVIIYFWYEYKNVKWIPLTIILLTVTTLLKAWSATAIVAIFFVLISLFINLRKNIKPLYSFIRLSIIYIIIWFIVVRFNSVSFFESIITDFLGKDLTFSGRTRIWDSVFESISYSPWYGFGINSEVLGGIVTFFAAHNMILQVILDTGFIGLILFATCVIIAGVKLQKNKNSRISVMLLIGIFGILIGGLSESYRLNYIFLLLIMSYNIKYIQRD
ncbi:O-antigen ligase family protein [Oceanobacillus sp. HCA-5259]|uniref:O-antigen ligase family protein n=1 Tax=Oceanobacillus sp. HCA-5259 TaxID=3134661 RepID=UPI0030BC3612